MLSESDMGRNNKRARSKSQSKNGRQKVQEPAAKKTAPENPTQGLKYQMTLLAMEYGGQPRLPAHVEKRMRDILEEYGSKKPQSSTNSTCIGPAILDEVFARLKRLELDVTGLKARVPDVNMEELGEQRPSPSREVASNPPAQSQGH